MQGFNWPKYYAGNDNKNAQKKGHTFPGHRGGHSAWWPCLGRTSWRWHGSNLDEDVLHSSQFQISGLAVRVLH